MVTGQNITVFIDRIINRSYYKYAKLFKDRIFHRPNYLLIELLIDYKYFKLIIDRIINRLSYL